MTRIEEWTDLEGDRIDVRFEQHFVVLDPNPHKSDALAIVLSRNGAKFGGSTNAVARYAAGMGGE